MAYSLQLESIHDDFHNEMASDSITFFKTSNNLCPVFNNYEKCCANHLR